jgi:hypothetical protein
MIDDPDVWRAAARLLRMAGIHRAIPPSVPSSCLGEAMRGAEVWRRILDALEELMRTKRRDDEPVN